MKVGMSGAPSAAAGRIRNPRSVAKRTARSLLFSIIATVIVLTAARVALLTGRLTVSLVAIASATVLAIFFAASIPNRIGQ